MGNRLSQFLWLAVSIILLYGCKHSSLKPAAYVKWIENKENKLKVEKKIGETKFILQYKPIPYMVFQEEKNLELDKSHFSKRAEELSEMQYYSLRILPSERNRDVLTVGINSEQEYFDRVNYFSFNFQNDIKLLDGEDTLYCTQFQFVNNYGLAPYADFVIAFKKQPEEIRLEKTLADKKFIIEDKVFGNGMVKFNIEKDIVNNIPSVLIN